jgi:hypothetical protein
VRFEPAKPERTIEGGHVGIKQEAGETILAISDHPLHQISKQAAPAIRRPGCHGLDPASHRRLAADDQGQRKAADAGRDCALAKIGKRLVIRGSDAEIAERLEVEIKDVRQKIPDLSSKHQVGQIVDTKNEPRRHNPMILATRLCHLGLIWPGYPEAAFSRS